MVYFLSHKNEETYSYGMKALDGDIKKIKPVDVTQDGGIEILPIRGKFGRPLEPAHIPTKIQIDGPKRELTDLREGLAFFVDEKFKDVVESLEPGVHQFFPVEFVWKDGSHAADRFWFVPCYRLDSVDRKSTTFEFRSIWYLDGDANKRLVFNRSQIGERHIWMDKYISGSSGVWISSMLKAALDEADVTGAHYQYFPETE